MHDALYDRRSATAAVDHNVIVVVDSSISLFVPSWHRHRPGTTSSDPVVLGVPPRLPRSRCKRRDEAKEANRPVSEAWGDTDAA